MTSRCGPSAPGRFRAGTVALLPKFTSLARLKREVLLAPFLRPATVADQWLRTLGAFSEEELGTLLRRRPDLAAANPRDLTELAGTMLGRPSAAMFYDNCDRSAQQVLEAVCVLPAPVTATSLGAALGCNPGALAALIDALRSAGMMLVHDSGEIVLNPGLAAGLPWPCRLGPPGAPLLRQLPNRELSVLAGRIGLSGTGNKDDLVRRLVRALSDPAHVASLLQKAPEGAAKLAKEAAFDGPQFQLSYGVDAMARNTSHPVGWCLQHAFLLGTGYSTAVMPREVGLALRQGRPFPLFSLGPPELLTRAVDQDQLDAAAAQAALALVSNVSAICEAWGGVPANLLQAGGLGTRELRRAAKLIGRAEDVTARLVELAAVAGLVEADELSGSAAPTEEYDRWRAGSSVERWLELATRWLNSPVHLSLAGAKGSNGKLLVAPLLDRGPDRGAIVHRTLFLDFLAGAGPGVAVDVESAAEVAEWARPSSWQSAIAAPRELVQWVASEAATIGLCAGDGLRAGFSSFGRALAEADRGGAEKLLARLAPTVVETVILQADLTATAAGEPAPALRAELDLLADVESSGQATVWRFSEPSLRRGFDAGRNAGDIHAFLAQRAARDIPQALSYLVDDMARRYGRARVGTTACYVRCEEPSLLAEVLTDKRVARLGLQLLAPTVAVSSTAAAEVLGGLQKAGYLPACENHDGTLSLSRPVAHRAGASSARARPGDGGRDTGWGPATDKDDPRAVLEPGETDEELLAELLEDPDWFTEMTGLSPELAKAMLQMATGDLSFETDLDALVERLRSKPVAGSAKPTSSGKAGPAKTGPTGEGGIAPADVLLSLFDNGPPRPTHIAKGDDEVADMLRAAAEQSWAVRMSYVNGEGRKSEFFAEVVGFVPGRARVRYVGDRAGGGELATYRVEWARVLTEAEEDALL